MSGDSAQGLLWDIKSCSNVGSIYLIQVGADAAGRKRQGSDRTHASGLYALHELEYSTRTPWQGERTFEYVSKQYVIGYLWLKKSS